MVVYDKIRIECMLERMYVMEWIDNIFDKVYEKCSILYRLWRDDKKIRWISCCLLVVVSLLIIFCIKSDIGSDVKNYQQYWLKYLDNDGLFSVYNHLLDENHRTNYPVLYFIFLFIMRPIFKCFENWFGVYGIAIFLKLNMLIMHCIISYFIYKKSSKLAFIWFFNPFLMWIFTMSIHFDELIVFLMIVIVDGISKNNPKQSLVCFTLISLLKLQGLYFLPVIIWCLIKQKEKLKWLIWTCCCAIVGIVIYIPFALKSNNLLLMFDVYLKGFSSQYGSAYVSSIWYPLTYVINQQYDYFYIIYDDILQALAFILLIMCIFWFIINTKKCGVEYGIFEYLLLINFITLSQDYRYFVYFLMFGSWVMIKNNRILDLKFLYKLNFVYCGCLIACQCLLIIINCYTSLMFLLSIIFLFVMMITWVSYCQYVVKHTISIVRFTLSGEERCKG